jgi:uncharacterized protein with HEPN domain
MRDDRERLLDMTEAIARIEKYTGRGQEDFLADELVQTYLVHHLQILGEAAYKLSPEFRNQHPSVPWRLILGMRHVLVHDYFRIDLKIVWRVVDKDLPPLKRQLETILDGWGS